MADDIRKASNDVKGASQFPTERRDPHGHTMGSAPGCKMRSRSIDMRTWCATILACLLVAGCGGGGGGGGGGDSTPPGPPIVNGPAWWNFGRDVQHAAQSGIATQSLSRIVWQAPVDLVPPYLANNVLHIHYGSPVITPRNTVLIPVKLNRDSGFRVEARAGANGALVWSAPTDYVLPAHDWTPSYNIALTQGNRVYWPGAGGKLYYRDDADSADRHRADGRLLRQRCLRPRARGVRRVGDHQHAAHRSTRAATCTSASS